MYRKNDNKDYNLSGTSLFFSRLANFMMLFFCFSYFPIYAQGPVLPLKSPPQSYTFDEIKLPGEEPIRDILALLQDSRGFVWMAGEHGLMRYDGHDFKIFHNIPGDTASIIDTNLLSLYLLGDTVLCVGGRHGISLMDIRTEKIINLEKDQDGNPVEWVNDFYPDKEGTIWVAGFNGLYSLKSDLSGITNHYLNTPPITEGNPAFAKRVYCIIQHSLDKNLLMLGTECGLISFDKKRNAIHKIYPNKEATFWRSQPPVYKFSQEGNYLWCKCWISGIPRFDMETESWRNFGYPKTGNRLETTQGVWAVNDFMLKNENEIWVCDWDRGLYVFDKNSEKLSPLKQEQTYGVLKKERLSIFKLKDGALWLSCKDGLWRQNLRAKQFNLLDIPYPHTWISATLHDEKTGEYYFGLHWESYGLACWNSSTQQWTYYQPERDKKEMFNTNDIFKDSRGVIWVASSRRGLWYIDKESKTLKSFSLPDKNFSHFWNHTIYKVFEDNKKNLWLGTGKHGIVRLNKDRTKADYFTCNTQELNSLYGTSHFRAIEEDQYGRIWIGSRIGFCTFDPKTGNFSREIPIQLQKQGIRDGYTYSIVKDTTNALWLTIEGQGLVKVEEQTKDKFNFKIYRTNDGLKDLSVYYMTADQQGGLWIVNNGLLYLNPYNNSFMLTDEQNGLLENLTGDIKIMVDCYGNVFCGEQVGINWLTEAQKHSVTNISNLIVEEVLVNGKQIKWYCEKKETIILSEFNHQSNLTFKYTAICFDDYNQVRYRYKLEGQETEWSPPTTVLEARYTNLKSGKYRFVVDVAYKGNWMELNQYVDFRIRPAFYKSWWFLTLVFALVFGIIYAINSNRKRQLEKQLKIRLKIASDLHDDVGSTLSSISIMSDVVQSHLGDAPKVEEMIREIGSNAYNMLESMDDIIWSVIPVNDSIENLVARIQEYAIPLFESKDIGFNIIVPQTVSSLIIPIEKRHDIFLVAKEAVNNLVKYSDCSEANIEFSVSRNVLKMKVSDNGKGFDTSQKYSRNGLKNMKYRAEKIDGKLNIQSEIGKGTIIKLEVKIR